jgi:hypothetical protein
MLSLERVARKGLNPYLRPLSALLSWLVPGAAIVATDTNTLYPDIQAAWDADPLSLHINTRVRNANEYLRVCEKNMAELESAEFAFLCFHSENDTMCDPDGSKQLFMRAQVSRGGMLGAGSRQAGWGGGGLGVDWQVGGRGLCPEAALQPGCIPAAEASRAAACLRGCRAPTRRCGWSTRCGTCWSRSRATRGSATRSPSGCCSAHDGRIPAACAGRAPVGQRLLPRLDDYPFVFDLR